jgi:hypothetical protein
MFVGILQFWRCRVAMCGQQEYYRRHGLGSPANSEQPKRPVDRFESNEQTGAVFFPGG